MVSKRNQATRCEKKGWLGNIFKSVDSAFNSSEGVRIRNAVNKVEDRLTGGIFHSIFHAIFGRDNN